MTMNKKVLQLMRVIKKEKKIHVHTYTFKTVFRKYLSS